ncbi:hypothetical protein K2P97_03120 [bacterium]|nr:hypothetical protein [bacterium]
MSKPVVKYAQKNTIKTAPQYPPMAPTSKSSYNTPALREVNLPVQNNENANIVTVYKDLNQEVRLQEFRQQKHLFTAFFVFILLGIGIVFGQKFFKSAPQSTASVPPPVSTAREISSSDMAQLIPKGAEETAINTHYHYDKTCYLAENGQQVCLTRTSQKNR